MMYSRSRVLTIIVTTLMFGVAGYSQSVVSPKDIPNFFRVHDTLARGAQPKDAGFAELKRLGFKTVIDLRDNDANALKEEQIAEAAGLRFINLPLGNWNRPATKDIDAILAEINNPDNQPVFVHCRRGSDRTGTVIAIERMTHDGWDAEAAAKEAEKFGIGWWQLGMRDFINDYYRDLTQKGMGH